MKTVLSMKIQKYCKDFRTHILRLTLKEFEVKTGVKVSTISSFENGRSNSMKHIETYAKACDSEQVEVFFSEIIDIFQSEIQRHTELLALGKELD